jgi:hypothetical protein
MADELNLIEVEIAIYAIDRCGIRVLGENAKNARDKLNRQRFALLRAAEEKPPVKRALPPSSKQHIGSSRRG